MPLQKQNICMYDTRPPQLTRLNAELQYNPVPLSDTLSLLLPPPVPGRTLLPLPPTPAPISPFAPSQLIRLHAELQYPAGPEGPGTSIEV